MAACNKFIVPPGTRSKKIKKKNFERKLSALQNIFPGTPGYEVYSFDDDGTPKLEFVMATPQFQNFHF